MNKEMIISSNGHDTRVAILEDDQVVEIFIERENQRGVVGIFLLETSAGGHRIGDRLLDFLMQRIARSGNRMRIDLSVQFTQPPLEGLHCPREKAFDGRQFRGHTARGQRNHASTP